MELPKIQSVPLTEEQQKEEAKRYRERKKQQDFLNPLLDSFCETIRQRISDVMYADADVKTYVQNKTIGSAIEIVDHCLHNLTTEVDEDNLVSVVDFFEHVFYLHCAIQQELEKHKNREEIPVTYATKLEVLEEVEEK